MRQRRLVHRGVRQSRRLGVCPGKELFPGLVRVLNHALGVFRIQKLTVKPELIRGFPIVRLVRSEPLSNGLQCPWKILGDIGHVMEQSGPRVLG